ncbi:MAG TPA: EamA family transporter [Bacillota bacterium]|nr:EamA family transporter [Bacillota bacterium]
MNSAKIVMPLSRRNGIAMVLTAGVLWGISGSVAQYLFQQQGYSPEWLVVIRLLTSGLILLGFAYKKEKQKIWEIWKHKVERRNLLIFGILGMLAVQYTYFVAIKQSNAATATILQYLAPVMITCFLAIRSHRFPTLKEIVAVGLALLGTFFLVTHGSISSLSISGLALFWGLISAVTLAFYTLYPHKLLVNWGATIVVGWAMLIGGIGFSLVHPPWKFEGQWSVSTILAVLFIILFGTLIAFYCYLESLNYLSASETSLLACVEPLSSAFLSVIWLHVNFGLLEWLGSLCILSTIVILSVVKEKRS